VSGCLGGWLWATLDSVSTTAGSPPATRSPLWSWGGSPPPIPLHSPCVPPPPPAACLPAG
jgi:hypothetical protein